MINQEELFIPDDHQHQLPAYQLGSAEDLHPVSFYLSKQYGMYQTPSFHGVI